jgi:hypothetical protein
VQSIEELRQDDDYSADYDPFTGGATDANQPIWDPTVFFSLILRVRLYRIHQEWIQVVTKLQESFKMNEPPPVCPCHARPRACLNMLFISVSINTEAGSVLLSERWLLWVASRHQESDERALGVFEPNGSSFGKILRLPSQQPVAL